MSVSVPKKVLDFLKKLKANNNRDWFNDHKQEFKAVEAEVKEAYGYLLELLRGHDDIDRLKIFRIYRDVRFSKDKTPFKTHFGGTFHRTKPRLRGGYYLHIDPDDSFIAAGFWQPEREDLLRIRKEFEADDGQIREIISAPGFKTTWGDLQGDEVKTAPKGFAKDHPAIDLIKKKQYIFTKHFTAAEVTAPDFPDTVNEAFRAIRPYFDYMSEVLTTDLNGVSVIE